MLRREADERHRTLDHLGWKTHPLLHPPPVVISDQRKRLATCHRDGTMRLNWRLIQLPDWLSDYVIVRQLVHLRHGSRGRTSRDAFARVMPDWHFRHEALQRAEPGLFW